MAAVTWSDVGETSRAARGAGAPVRPRDGRAAGGPVPLGAGVVAGGGGRELPAAGCSDRVNALAALSVRLEGLARLADELAAAAELLGAAEQLEATGRPVLGSGGRR